MPRYASFIKNKHEREFAAELIRLSKAYDLPMLKFFTHLDDEKLLDFVCTNNKELLTNLSNNNADAYINLSLERWINNQLPQFDKGQLIAEDITLLGLVRKHAFYNFLPRYTSNVEEVVGVIKELDVFVVASETASFKTFVQLMGERLQEQVDFTEKISATSPGLVYICDLETEKIIYSNWKVNELLGYQQEELTAMGEQFISLLQHPDDRSVFKEHRADFFNRGNDEIRMVSHRMKHKDGDYRWVRNYESVFKRNAIGAATQIIGISFDIDAEKKTSEKLLQREEQLLQAQELAGIGSFEWNLETMKGTATPQLAKILELTELFELNHFGVHIHPEDKARVEQNTSKAIVELGLYDYECRYLTPTGEKVIWSKGEVTRKLGVLTVKGTLMDVSERNRIITRMLESEAMYKEAQSISHIGNWTYNLKDGSITWSDELYRIYEQETTGNPYTFDDLLVFNHKDDAELVQKAMKTAAATHLPSDFYHRIITPKGQTKILHTKGETLTDVMGVAYKMIGTVQDVTEQKQIEKELQESRNFIQKIADATPSIITSYNLHTGKYSFVSQGLQKLLGYLPVTLLSEGATFLLNKIHPEDLDEVIRRNQQAVAKANGPAAQGQQQEIIAEFRYRVLHQDGSYRWIQTYGTVFDRNSQGEVEHILNISVDITENLEAEKRLVEQERFITHIAEASPTILYLFDLEKRSFLYINREVKQVMGYEPEEIIALGNKAAVLYLHPEDNLGSPDKHTKYIHPEGNTVMHQFEGRVRDKNRKWKWLLTREIVFKRDTNGKALQVLGSALDITDRKEMEQSLKYKTIQLQQSNASLEEFAHVASHDLQEPLRKISTFGDRLLYSHKGILTNEGEVYLNKIILSSKRMQQLVSDILSLSLISGEKSFIVYSLNTLLDEVLQTLEYKIETLQAHIVSEHLPDVCIVPSQFRQLLQNLLSNSLKFSKQDVTPEIRISHAFADAAEVARLGLRNSPQYLKLFIEDNGIGFDEEYAEKIFAIFQRLNNRAAYEGTGIGLAIARKIVENHGGIITAKSTPGAGSAFCIIIPA